MDDTFNAAEIALLEGVRDDALEEAAILVEKLGAEQFVSVAQLIRALKHVPYVDQEAKTG